MYQVTSSAVCARQLADLEERAKRSPGSSHEAIWDAVRRTLAEVLPDEELVMSQFHYFTKEGHDFGNVFRAKIGRGRLFYIASSAQKVVRVLVYGFRKEGDRRDAYKEFSRLLRGGRFDADFSELGVKRPKG